MNQVFFDILDTLGYTTEYADLSGYDRLGECVPAKKLVRLHDDLTDREHPYVLGHETWHAINDDVPTMFGHFDARMERRADEWSASMCIDIELFREFEEQFSGHIPTIAFHLGVPDEAVEVYTSMLLRLGDNLFVGSKMGAGQWRMKIEVA